MGKLTKLLKVADISDEDLSCILDIAKHYMRTENAKRVLEGKVVANLFFENSTRTLLAFEIAEKALGAVSVTLNVDSSSISKGESVTDTISTMGAMGVDMFVMRSGISGMIESAINAVGDGKCVVNAGDGLHEHPTQAITDYATICDIIGSSNISGLKVTICGDVFHSRVARSNIRLLSRFGAVITVVVLPGYTASAQLNGVSSVVCSIEEGIKDADVIMLLRMQKERIEGDFISEKEYSKYYMLDKKRLSCAKDKVIVMHPGPVNRGIEISDEVADSSCSAILLQVKVGAAIRKAILHHMLV